MNLSATGGNSILWLEETASDFFSDFLAAAMALHMQQGCLPSKVSDIASDTECVRRFEAHRGRQSDRHLPAAWWSARTWSSAARPIRRRCWSTPWPSPADERDALHADLDLIRDAALAAGDLAVRMRAAGLTTEIKADGTPVTNADLAVDALLKATCWRARPDYGWLSEETADDPARLGASACSWSTRSTAPAPSSRTGPGGASPSRWSSTAGPMAGVVPPAPDRHGVYIGRR